MHKRRFNEFTLTFAIQPRGPLLIKSGQESGADPTLLDMNFVRTQHMGLGESTVYLPGSSLKGTLRSYAEKIARTVGEGRSVHPPFSCNPLGRSSKKGSDDYFCGQFLDNKRFNQADKHRLACPICRTFGHTSLAAHCRLSDAYPLDPANRDDRTLFEQTNSTEERDGVAIDRVSGAVAVGPFNLEVVTQGAFFGSLTLHNFELWQLGLLAIVLRDLGNGLVPIGFAKSRGLGQVSVTLQRAEVAYPGRFSANSNGRHLDQELYGVTGFLDDTEAGQYGYHRTKEAKVLPGGFVEVAESGDYGRYALAWPDEAIQNLWRTCVDAWRDFVTNWEGVAENG